MRRAHAYPRTRAEVAASADHRRGGWPSTRRCGAGTWPARRCSRSVGRWASRVGTVRKFAYAPSFPERAAGAPSGPSILDPTSPTWRCGSPRGARTRWRCGASCARSASRARTGRCTAGWPSVARRPRRARRTGGAPGGPARHHHRAGLACRRRSPAEAARLAPRAAAAAPARGGGHDRRAGRAGWRGGDRRGPGAPLHRARARLL